MYNNIRTKNFQIQKWGLFLHLIEGTTRLTLPFQCFELFGILKFQMFCVYAPKSIKIRSKQLDKIKVL